MIRSRKISHAVYKRMHARIYRKLHKIAFDNYFVCSTPGCNSHKDLVVHYKAYDEAHWDDPEYYEIKCAKCHRKKHRKRRCSIANSNIN